jgi:hypothetical protein
MNMPVPSGVLPHVVVSFLCSSSDSDPRALPFTSALVSLAFLLSLSSEAGPPELEFEVPDDIRRDECVRRGEESAGKQQSATQEKKRLIKSRIGAVRGNGKKKSQIIVGSFPW